MATVYHGNDNMLFHVKHFGDFTFISHVITIAWLHISAINKTVVSKVATQIRRNIDLPRIELALPRGRDKLLPQPEVCHVRSRANPY